MLDLSTTIDLRVARVRPEQKLLAVLEIARDLGGTIDLDGVLEKVLGSLFRIFPQADRGFILLRGGGADELVLKASKVRSPRRRARRSSAGRCSLTSRVRARRSSAGTSGPTAGSARARASRAPASAR